MQSFVTLFNAAKEKGLNIDASTQIFDRWGDSMTPETHISIEIEPYVWYTWESATFWNNNLTEREANFEKEVMFFKGRYNQNNAAHQRTIKKEYKALRALGLTTIVF